MKHKLKKRDYKLNWIGGTVMYFAGTFNVFPFPFEGMFIISIALVFIGWHILLSGYWR